MSALPHGPAVRDQSRAVAWALLATVTAFAAFAVVIGLAGWAGLSWVAAGSQLR